MNLPALGPTTTFLFAVLGWTVVHFLWQGAALGLATEAALAALRGAVPRTRERVAWMGLAAMALVFAATGVRMAASGIQGGIAMTLEAERVLRNVPLDLLTAGERAAVRGIPAATASIGAPWIGASWLALALVLTSGLAFGWWQTRQLRSRSTRSAGALAESLGHQLARGLGIRHPVRILASDALGVPAVAGWLAPAVLLPAKVIAELPPDSLAAVIAHELAHVRRGDGLRRVAQRALRALLFFHPSAHRLMAAIDRERERACDDLAVAICGSPVTYARALARIERLRPRVPEMAMAADGAPLLARVRRLLEPEPALPDRRARRTVIAATAMSLGIAVLVVGVAPAGDLARPARAAIAVLRARHVQHEWLYEPGTAGDPDGRLRLKFRDVERIRTPHVPRAGPARFGAGH